MKRIIIAVFIFIGAGLFVSALSQEPLHYRLASDPAIHGKGKDGECMNYAQFHTLYGALKERVGSVKKLRSR